MSRYHGSTSKVYLGSRDVSADLSSINISAMADVGDVTTFNSASAKEFDPGLYGWEAEINAFYQGQALGIGQQLETLLGAAGGIISVYNGPTLAIGSTGVLLSDGVLTKRGQPIAVADLIKLTGSFKATGAGTRPGLNGILMHVSGAESATGNGIYFDCGASSANGGRANLHVLAVTGTGGTVAIKDSSDGLVDLSSPFNFAASTAIGAQTLEVTTSLGRYLRVRWVIPGASSITFVVGVARY